MFCENCGKEIKDGERFCRNCGSEIKKRGTGLEPESQKTFAIKGASKKKNWKTITIIALVIVVVIGIFKWSSKEETLKFNVRVVNNTGFDICALYASEPNVDNWEEDLLDENILCDGEKMNIEFIITEDNLDWDFAIEDVEGNILEFYGLSFAECDVDGATLILEYDGYETTATLY